MRITEMRLDDICSVVPLYISYYNEHEDGCWTEQTAITRITQVLTIKNSYSLIMRDDEDSPIGFIPMDVLQKAEQV